MPTVTGDLRIGGFILPFDIGFNFCSVDSTKFGEDFESKIDPVAFDFYTIGADLRYALVQGGGFVPRWSIGVGGYYTKGNVSVANSTAKASLDFETTTIYASTQASVKFLCLIPFVGGRVMASRSTAGWNATANWSEILDDGPSLQQALEIGLLPESFGGQETVDVGDKIIRQVCAGVGFVLFIIHIASSAGYDFYIPFSAVIMPGQTITVPTGIRARIDNGWFLMCCPRSGLGFKFRLRLDNTVGIIDSDYFGADNEGHIMIRVTNESNSGKILELKHGDAFAQGIFIPFGITVDDNAADKRTGGFGSTSS